MKSVYKLFITSWILGFMAAVVTAPQPPIIAKFLSEDLISPGEVPFQRSGSLKLPCAASGSNLSWTWKHNDTVISNFLGHPYSLSADGTLTGSYLSSEHSGTYQCFVKDQKMGIEVFSRKVQVAVTVVGKFSNTDDVEKKVNLGQPFSFQCPNHTDSFGATYQWVGNNNVQFSRNARRGISPNGNLHFLYVTEEDIDEINKNKGVRCTIQGANTRHKSRTMKLVKKNEGEKDPGNLRSPSWLVVPPAKVVTVEGHDTTLYCLATGRPAPRITWSKNGKKIVHGQNSYKILHKFYGRRLDVNNLNKVKHQDRYTCEAENSQSNGKPLVHSINLVVEVPPRWTITPPPKKMELNLGRSGKLECHVTAVPTAKITWYKNGRQLQTSDKSAHLKIDGDKLHLRDVNHLSDGVYQCAAENRHGMLASATWVHVQAPRTTGEATESETDVYAAMMIPEATEQREERKKSNLGVILGASVAVGMVITVGFVLWKKCAKKMTSRERLLKELIDEMEGKWEEENPDRHQRERSKFWKFLSLKMRGGLEKIREVFQRKSVTKDPTNTARENQRKLHDQICNQGNMAHVGENNSQQRTQEILKELFHEKSRFNKQDNHEVFHRETSQMNTQGVQEKLQRVKSCTDKQGYQIDLRKGKPHKDTKEDLESLDKKNSHHDTKKDQEDLRQEISPRDITSHQKDIGQEGSHHDLQNLQENMQQEGSHHDIQRDQKGSFRDQDTLEQQENICKEGLYHELQNLFVDMRQEGSSEDLQERQGDMYQEGSKQDIQKQKKGSSQDVQIDREEIRQEGSHHDIQILQEDMRKESSSRDMQERKEDMHQEGSNEIIQNPQEVIYQKGSSQDMQDTRREIRQEGSHHDIQIQQEDMRKENSSKDMREMQEDMHQEVSNEIIQNHQEVLYQKRSSQDMQDVRQEIRQEGSHHDIQILEENMRRENSSKDMQEMQEVVHQEGSNEIIQNNQEVIYQNGSGQDIQKERGEILHEGSHHDIQIGQEDMRKKSSSQNIQDRQEDMHQEVSHRDLLKHQKVSSQDLQQDGEEIRQEGSHHNIQILKEEMCKDCSSQDMQREQEDMHQEGSNHYIQILQEDISKDSSSQDMQREQEDIHQEGSNHYIQVLQEDMRKESSSQNIQEKQDDTHQESSNQGIKKRQEGSSQDMQNDREDIRQEGSPQDTPKNDDDVHKEGSSQDIHKDEGDIDQGNSHEDTQEDQ